jgi:DNA repair protein RadC
MRKTRKQSKQVYVTHEPLTAHQVLEKAAEILAESFKSGEQLNNPQSVKQYLSCQLARKKREVFAVLLMDTSHRLIEYHELFYGTIDGASVYPREVIQLVLEKNAAAVILAHNHPSGNAEPSVADKKITQRISEALALIDVRVLDHIVVGEKVVSFAEMGLL